MTCKAFVIKNVNKDVTVKIIENHYLASKNRKRNKNNPNISTSEMVFIIGKTIRTVARIVESGKKIRRIGPDKEGYW